MRKKDKKIPKTLQKYLSWMISGIKSQIPSLYGHKKPKSLPLSTGATLDDVDRFLFENFRSLYGEDEIFDDQESKEEVKEFENPTVTNLCETSRFFFSPVSCRSLIEEARTKTSCLGINDGDCIAVVTASESPYEDFKRSMAEVMKARLKHGKRIDWEFMEELLFCYLRLNVKDNYRFVLRAFVDLVVELRPSCVAGDGGNCGGDLVAAGLGWSARRNECRLRYFA